MRGRNSELLLRQRVVLHLKGASSTLSFDCICIYRHKLHQTVLSPTTIPTQPIRAGTANCRDSTPYQKCGWFLMTLCVGDMETPHTIVLGTRTTRTDPTFPPTIVRVVLSALKRVTFDTL